GDSASLLETAHSFHLADREMKAVAACSRLPTAESSIHCEDSHAARFFVDFSSRPCYREPGAGIFSRPAYSLTSDSLLLCSSPRRGIATEQRRCPDRSAVLLSSEHEPVNHSVRRSSLRQA